MITILVGILVISQLFCFYIIAILNTKVSKFQDLEARQNQLIREMEDSFSLYLVEIKEENDRLIEEFSKARNAQTDKNEDDVIHFVKEASNHIEDKDKEQVPLYEKKIVIPKSIVKNAYNRNLKKQVQQFNEEPILQPLEPINDGTKLSFEEQVLQYHVEGKSIEQIAKLTNKGKTEIELLIKFNN